MSTDAEARERALREEAHERALRQKYPDDALVRLVRANTGYLRDHYYYLPEVAALLLIERAACEARVAALEQREKDVAEALRRIADNHLPVERTPWSTEFGDHFIDGQPATLYSVRTQTARDYARAVLSARPTEEKNA